MCGTHIVLVTKRYLIQFKAHLTWEIFPCTINLDNFSWLMKSWSLRKGSMMLPCSTSRIPYRISNLTLVLTVKLSCHPKPKSSLQLIEVTMILFLKSLCLLIYFPFPLFFNFFPFRVCPVLLILMKNFLLSVTLGNYGIDSWHFLICFSFDLHEAFKGKGRCLYQLKDSRSSESQLISLFWFYIYAYHPPINTHIPL